MPIKFARFLACGVFASLLPLLSAAQTTSPPADSSTPTQTPASPDKSQDKVKDAPQAPPTNNRLGMALPNYLTVEMGTKVPPLDAKHKFQLVAKGAFDPVNFAWYGLLSSINQADNSEPGFGQGWDAYGKRYGATMADGVIENFMVGAVLPSMFHQDPRFYQMGQGSFGRRLGYSATRILVTRGDNGKRQFNISEVLGSAMAASISTFTYHPHSTILSTPTGPKFIPSDRTLTNAASVWGSQLGYDAATIVIKEFWPDVHRKFSHKNKTEAASAAGTNP